MEYTHRLRYRGRTESSEVYQSRARSDHSDREPRVSQVFNIATLNKQEKRSQRIDDRDLDDVDDNTSSKKYNIISGNHISHQEAWFSAEPNLAAEAARDVDQS